MEIEYIDTNAVFLVKGDTAFFFSTNFYKPKPFLFRLISDKSTDYINSPRAPPNFEFLLINLIN